METARGLELRELALAVVTAQLQEAHDMAPRKWRAIEPEMRGLLDSFSVGYAIAFQQWLDAYVAWDENTDVVKDARLSYCEDSLSATVDECAERLWPVAESCGLSFTSLVLALDALSANWDALDGLSIQVNRSKVNA